MNKKIKDLNRELAKAGSLLKVQNLASMSAEHRRSNTEQAVP